MVRRGAKGSPGEELTTSSSVSAFTIVGVGASAGGLQPFLELLRGAGDASELAFVYVLHQEKHEDALHEVVARATSRPVVLIAEGVELEEGKVYVAPSDSLVTLQNLTFSVRPRGEGRELSVDAFLYSLAEEHGSRGVAVLLSGSGSDGAEGCRAVKTAGGFVFTQNASAQFPQMAQAAMTAGAVDSVLPPYEIGRELVRLATAVATVSRFSDRDLAPLFELLNASHDVDFTYYKPNTIERRIRRRMALHGIDELPRYVALLGENLAERDELHRDILIRVTRFFRDPEVFETLRRDIVPRLLQDRKGDAPLRVWVPGCATGEEVYSLAILLFEAAEDASVTCPVQIFGTDVNHDSIDRARVGIYPEHVADEISPERLRRYFVQGDGGYRVAKAIRDCCIFARQNLTRDPPFSRLDLVSCRNVLIYLGPVLQRKVMSIFHYALRPNAYLLLGSSETIGNYGELFTVADRTNKIYRKKPAASRLDVIHYDADVAARPQREKPPMAEEAAAPVNVFREADRVVLSRFSPPAVLINENLEVLQFRGRTSLFLEPPAGVASFNVLKMAREGLLAELRSAIHMSQKTDIAVRREGIRVRTDSDFILVDLEVLPFFTAAGERYLLVLFEQRPEPVEASVETASAKGKKGKGTAASNAAQVTRLERELEATREYLQSIIEEQEAMNEELRSANEEIQSSNEELQSTNEELETAKEELQSSNEELTTLNEELENRNQELAQANSDLVNILASVDVPIVLLDSALRIRRFNPGAQRVLHLIGGDVGRPLTDLKATLVIEDFERIITAVIENLEVRELEVQDRDGKWYSLRVRPYKTTENKIDGAVLVLIDIDQLRRK